MKIVNSSVALKSSHTLVSRKSQQTSLTMWVGNARLSGAQVETGDTARERAFKAEIGTRRFSPLKLSAAHKKHKPKTEKEAYSDARLKLIEEMLYLLTGKRIRVKDPADCMEDVSSGDASLDLGQPMQGFGVIFTHTESFFEAESVNFSAAGSVRTADGRSIEFDLRFAMERSYYEQHRLEIRMGDAAVADPLAIDLGGGTIGLTGAKFSFDLDGDGSLESISFLTGQAGFLALDKNGDGKINDGMELFGTRSGDGFRDLAVYDEDKNGWIDEADPVFSKLKMFNMNADGSAALISLGEAGVGALYLGAVSSQFSFKQGQTLQGELRKSSVYLKENGQAGFLHHIDLAI
ncbi:MAG TPA: hypothetical protein VN512_10925 [Clostridia bacterium]|nr:hypothetical protein [Clostridia bacterium]